MSDHPPPPSTREPASRSAVSAYAALIVAITGLVTVFVHKPTEDAARAGYLELTTAILESQAETKKNHDDIVALRSFLEDYTRGHVSIVTPIPTSPSSLPPVGVVGRVLAEAPSAAPAPPPIAPQAVLKSIKAADAIQW
jgi:hypothetical protein